MILKPVGENTINIGDKKVKVPAFDIKKVDELAENLAKIWEGKIRRIGTGAIIYFKKNSFNYGLKFWGRYDFLMNFEPRYAIAFISKEDWEKI